MVLKESMFIVFALVALGSAALHKLPPSKSECPGHPNHCYDKEADSFYKIGSVQTRKGSCASIECLEDFSMELATCGKIEVNEGCKLSEPDLSKEYPACCPQLACD